MNTVTSMFDNLLDRWREGERIEYDDLIAVRDVMVEAPKPAQQAAEHVAEIEHWKAKALTAEKWRGIACARYGDGRTVQMIQQEAVADERARASVIAKAVKQPAHQAVDWTQAWKLIEVVHDHRVRQHTTGTSNWAAAVCRLMSEAAPQPAQPSAAWTARELELIDAMIDHYRSHAIRCDGIANRQMAEKQKGWDMERVALLRKTREMATPQPAQPQPKHWGKHD